VVAAFTLRDLNELTNMDTPINMKTSDTPTKESYERPELVVYGDIHELTQNVGATGGPDGGFVLGHKSSQP
jgi:hypothetical protein